jgi:acyl-CoA thioesterase FadM
VGRCIEWHGTRICIAHADLPCFQSKLRGSNLTECGILARTEIDFLAEAFPAQALTLGIRVPRVGTKSFDFEYLLVRDEDNVTVARGKSVQVMFDYAAKVTVPVTDEIRARLDAFEGRG